MDIVELTWEEKGFVEWKLNGNFENYLNLFIYFSKIFGKRIIGLAGSWLLLFFVFFFFFMFRYTSTMINMKMWDYAWLPIYLLHEVFAHSTPTSMKALSVWEVRNLHIWSLYFHIITKVIFYKTCISNDFMYIDSHYEILYKSWILNNGIITLFVLILRAEIDVGPHMFPITHLILTFNMNW